jgi:hypothetical protein
MEAPKPIMITSRDNIENNFLNFNLFFNSTEYECSFFDINNEKIKITIKLNNNHNKFEAILNFNDFKELNKYFKMFDTLKELENDLIGLYNSKKIEISNVSENNLNLCITVLTLDNNKVIITLNKYELSDNEKINIILKENKEIKNENQEIKKELKIKEAQINSLEKEIQNLKIEFSNFQKIINEKLIIYKDINSNLRDKVTLKYNSEIFLNNEEKGFILKQISNNIKSVNLIFSSKIHGTDINTLKNAYLNKPNLIFCIKSKKGKRFGAYASETFLDNEFNKVDRNAFLFSLDNKKIIKSKCTSWDIWNQDCNSIQFGGGTDLRIYYDFISNKNYTNQVKSYYEYNDCPEYVLNEEYHFSIDIFEIYQILFETKS